MITDCDQCGTNNVECETFYPQNLCEFCALTRTVEDNHLASGGTLGAMFNLLLKKLTDAKATK
jgi:hypothetical protein